MSLAARRPLLVELPFSPAEVHSLLDGEETERPYGARNFALILFLLDTQRYARTYTSEQAVRSYPELNPGQPVERTLTLGDPRSLEAASP